MAKKLASGSKKPLKFHNKLLLNQWLVSLFDIDPLAEHEVNGNVVRPFHKLVEPIRRCKEGLNEANLHHFYHCLADSFSSVIDRTTDPSGSCISRDMLLNYEQNIVKHTLKINENRERKVVWKYYQWLTLIFVEIYLDRFFGNRQKMLADLNVFVKRFNEHWDDYADVPSYDNDDLNKLCLQNATGSGKTLLMHVNLLQYRHYAKHYHKDNDLSRVILLTPNEHLSKQHIAEFKDSSISADNYQNSRGSIYDQAPSLEHVDVLEITKLGDQDGQNTIATQSLGDNNLLLVDEGHRGMSGKEEGVWFQRRKALCDKGFTFEYSATFEQAVQASGSAVLENSYAKAIVFDYSYRWFYEDGFGKDYQILNLPKSFKETQSIYMTACLLKFYQQLRIYEEKAKKFEAFNLEKPLWVFVGSTVSSGKISQDKPNVVTDVALIIQFIADFLDKGDTARNRIQTILTRKGQDTGLLDKDDNDIFDNAFNFLAQARNSGETNEALYRDILARLFNHAAGGHLSLQRIKGESGEVALRVGNSEIPFGLINVGDAKSLCDHVAEAANRNSTRLTVEDSDFTETMFASVNDSTSPVNLLIGSKKFVEGWDCWRVSTLGLMHVGRSEGSQIIQLFGRGVRLKGYEWSLKRSQYSKANERPKFIEELETLNVFGIEADFMEKFREFLKEEGLPGKEGRTIVDVQLNVNYNFDKNLKILRPKRKVSDDQEYDFKKDAAMLTVGCIPKYMNQNSVVVDWYPRIMAMQSRGTPSATQKDKVSLREQHLALLDYDTLFFELERFKLERGWYNFNITKDGIKKLLKNRNWYTLYFPETSLNPATYDGVLLLQQVASELLKRYCDRYYNYRKRGYTETRLELRDLTRDDGNIPKEEKYQLVVDGGSGQVIGMVNDAKKYLEKNIGDHNVRFSDLNVCNFGVHLFQPLFSVRSGGKITILPVALNESEYKFVTDLMEWWNANQNCLKENGTELFLLRNMSRGKGVGFFEASNFHPDFILWLLKGDKQYITFIEPHSLLHEGPASEKVKFHERIKDVEKRLMDKTVILNSFILSRTEYPKLEWDKTKKDLEDMHVLFMKDESYICKLFDRLISTPCLLDTCLKST